MKRNSNWASSLMTTIEAARKRPFLWGEHDCVNFAANCIFAMTGEDPMAAFRGTYDSFETAQEALKTNGKGTLYHTMVSIFGQPASAGGAQRGDLIYQVFPNGPAIGVVVGSEVYFVGALTQNEIETPGLQSIALSPTAKIFKV